MELIAIEVRRKSGKLILPPAVGELGTIRRKGGNKPVFVEMKITHYGTKSHICSASDFLSKEECRNFIQWSDACGFESVDSPATKQTAHRRQKRMSFEDTDGVVADAIFDRLRPLLPESIDGLQPIGCSKNIRVYKYEQGDSFGKHIDESQRDEETRGISKLTLLIYLNGGDCEDEFQLVGGCTNFYASHSSRDPFLSVPPCRGTLLLHGHGSRCLTHEGSIIENGIKYVLRTDVLYR